MKKAYFIFMGILIFIFILISTVFGISFNLKYYSYQHEKNGVYEVYNKDLVDDITAQIVEYIKSEREYLNYKGSDGLNVFSQRELMHMEDVRRLFEFYGKIQMAISAAVLLSIICLRKIAYACVEGILKGISISLNVFLVLSIFAFLNFGYMFEKFHELFFENEFWILDSNESIIINILPINFFSGTALWIFILTISFTVLIMTILNAFKNHIQNDSIY